MDKEVEVSYPWTTHGHELSMMGFRGFGRLKYKYEYKYEYEYEYEYK